MYLNLFQGTTAEYFDYWLENYCKPRLARNTYNGYSVNVRKHILPKIGEIKLTELEPRHIQQMYSELSKEGLTGTSVVYVHATLRKALNSAIKQGMLQYNVTNYIEPPRKSDFKGAVLTAEQVHTLLFHCRYTEVYLPVLLAISLGLRRGEVLGLKWSDIDFENHTLEIQRTGTYFKGEFYLSSPKTKTSNRTLLVNDMCYSALLEEMNRQKEQSKTRTNYNPNSLVVLRFNGELLTSTVLNKQFKRALKRGKLPDVRFHDLRHTNATLLLKKQVPAKIVSNMLGHSSIGITLDTYSHVMVEMQDLAKNAMDDILK